MILIWLGVLDVQQRTRLGGTRTQLREKTGQSGDGARGRDVLVVDRGWSEKFRFVARLWRGAD